MHFLAHIGLCTLTLHFSGLHEKFWHKNHHTRVIRVLYFDCFAFCFLTWTKFLNPKYPDPSKLAILRTQTPLYRFKHFHWRVQSSLWNSKLPYWWVYRRFLPIVSSEDPVNTKPNGDDFRTEIYPGLMKGRIWCIFKQTIGVFMANSPSALKHSKPGNFFSRTHKMLELAFNERSPSNLYILRWKSPLRPQRQ